MPTEVRIVTTTQDALALAALVEEWATAEGAPHEPDFTESFAAEYFGSGTPISWIAWQAAAAIGYLSAQQVTPTRRPSAPAWRWLHIDGFYVTPAQRNTGVGSKLLAELGAWGHQNGFVRAVVTADDRARNCYARARFQPRPRDMSWKL